MRAVIDKIEIQHIPDEESTLEEGTPQIGVVATATVRVHLETHPEGHALIQTISSGGIWGIDAESEQSYLAAFADEQRSELDELLAAFGLGVDRDAISDAVALDRIAERLDGSEWSADDCEAVAGLVRDTGREVREVDDLDPNGDKIAQS